MSGRTGKGFDRLLAAAERAAAEAFRAHEVPSDEVRKAIRASGSETHAQASVEQWTVDLEKRRRAAGPVG